MSNRFTYGPFYKYVLLLTDVTGFYGSFYLSHYLRLGKILSPESQLQLIPELLVTLVLMYIFDVYKVENRLDFFKDLSRLFIAVLLVGVLMVVGEYALGVKNFSGYTGRGILIGALIIFFVWSSLWRILIIKRVKSLQQKTRWLVVGTTEYLKQFLADFNKNINDVQLVCLVENQQMLEDLQRHFPHLDQKIQINGTWTDLNDWLNYHWMGIIVAVGQGIPEEMINQLMTVRFKGIPILDLSDFYEIVWRKVPVYYLNGSWFALSQGFHLLHNPIGLRLKRVGDIVIACILFIFSLPIMILAGFFVALTSGFPIIYSQKRKGINGEEFIIYKFRSMKKNAEKNGQAQWAQVGDQRITPWGYFMRLTRIDELPQVWNILKGDMSFIGPRPERPEFTHELNQNIPFYEFRHLVRPGLSGWAQVMYPYGSSFEDAKEKLQFELYYIKNYSLLLDWLVLLKTVRVVLLGRGR